MFIPPEEPVMPTLISSNETNAEFKTQPVIVEERSFEHNFYTYMSSYTFHSLNCYVLFHLKDHFCNYCNKVTWRKQIRII